MILQQAAAAIGGFVIKSFNTPEKVAAGIVGMLWAAIDPAIPFLIVCTFFVFIDCISAWMLSRRVARLYPEHGKGSKFTSQYASEIFNTLAIIWFLVIGCYWLDESVFSMVRINIANWVAGAFCMVQIVSILENCSSCNGSTWAVVLQKVLADKTSRHLKIDIEKLVREAKEEQKQRDTRATGQEEAQGDAKKAEDTAGAETAEEQTQDEAAAEAEKRRRNRERSLKAAETRRRRRAEAAGAGQAM